MKHPQFKDLPILIGDKITYRNDFVERSGVVASIRWNKHANQGQGQIWMHVEDDPAMIITESGVIGHESGNRRLREGDQELPTPQDTPSMHSLVQEDLERRLQVGISRYGTPLQAHNGRDALQDAYDEILDLSVYLRQEIEERKDHNAAMKEAK